MADLTTKHGRRCVAGDCPTDIQAGTDGMLAHLQTIHFPNLTRAQLQEKYRAELWPETAAAADG